MSPRPNTASQPSYVSTACVLLWAQVMVGMRDRSKVMTAAQRMLQDGLRAQTLGLEPSCGTLGDLRGRSGNGRSIETD